MKHVFWMVAVVMGLLTVAGASALYENYTYTTPGTYTLSINNTDRVWVEVWGGGGGGGGVSNNWNAGGGGGGGGAYSAGYVTIVRGQNYTLFVGGGGTGGNQAAGGNGQDSWFGNNTTIMAKGGTGGRRDSDAADASKSKGGNATLGYGTTKYSGGNGSIGGGPASGTGVRQNAGGGGAGKASNGGNAADTTAGAGGTAGGGIGGAGRTTDGNGNTPSTIGGGGGGAFCDSGCTGSSWVGAAGERGEVRVYFAEPTFLVIAATDAYNSTALTTFNATVTGSSETFSLLDKSGNGNTLTNNRATYNSTDNSYNFDGTENLATPLYSYVNGTNDFSQHIRLSITDPVANNIESSLFTFRPATALRGAGLSFANYTGGQRFSVRARNASATVQQNSVSTITTGQVYDLMVVFNNTNRTAYFYQNGVLDFAMSYSSVLLEQMTQSRIGAGAIVGGSTGDFNGTVYKANFWNRALSASEVATVYANGSVTDGLVALYNFDDYTSANYSTTNGTIITAFQVSATQLANVTVSAYRYLPNITVSLNTTVLNALLRPYLFLSTIDNKTSLAISAACYLNGTEYTTADYLPYDNTNSETLTCEKFAYNNASAQFTAGQTNSTWTVRMQPVELCMIFSEATNVTISYVGNITTNVTFTNVTKVEIDQDDMPADHIIVTYNEGRQKFEYVNDQDTNICERFYIQTPDIAKPMIVWDRYQQLDGRVLIYRFVGSTWQNVYTSFTSRNEVKNMMLDDGQTYKIIATVDGYDSSENVYYLEQGNLNTLLLEVTSDSTKDEDFTYYTNCNRYLDASTNCQFTTTTDGGSWTIGYVWNNSLENGSLWTYATTSATLNLTIANGSGNTTVQAYVDGALTKVWQVSYAPLTSRDIQINIEPEDTGVQESLGLIAFTVLLIAAVIGGLVESRFPGFGIHVAMTWITLAAGMAMPVFYALGAVYFIWTVFRMTRGVGG
jgi:hypothetical protein